MNPAAVTKRGVLAHRTFDNTPWKAPKVAFGFCSITATCFLELLCSPSWFSHRVARTYTTVSAIPSHICPKMLHTKKSNQHDTSAANCGMQHEQNISSTEVLARCYANSAPWRANLPYCCCGWGCSCLLNATTFMH